MSEAPPILRVEFSPGRIGVHRGESPTPILVQNAETDRRPYIHPIVSPDGIGVVTEDAPNHHPWQHGLYIGLNAVNGYGFWTEGLAKAGVELDGTFHPRVIGTPSSHDNQAHWAIETEYRSPAGDPVLDERQRWSLTDEGERYVLDLEWTLTGRVAVTLGAYPYGGLFLRMPFRPESGGSVLTSEGRDQSGGDGQRARWVAVRMPLPERAIESQVAIMDHRDNLEHPVPWRVDRQLGISPSVSIAGEWRLAAGEARVFRYRVLVCSAPVGPSAIGESWRSFNEKGHA